MKIVADENMPDLEPLADLGELVRLPGRSLGPDQVRDADALLVRSVTRVDRRLLEGSRVRFVGSATIGTDHVEHRWLAANGITFVHAPGCNARAVAEYVLQAILAWALGRGREPESLRVGLVGLGSVGSDVQSLVEALDIRVLACDPLREARGESCGVPWRRLDEVLAADVVSLHVPLTLLEPRATRHLLDRERLGQLGADQLLINTARGAVVDNEALSARLGRGDGPAVVLDVWENEPRVPAVLFRQVWRGTPHVAGYSLEGRRRGSRVVAGALAAWAGRPLQLPETAAPEAEFAGNLETARDLLELLRFRYSLEADHARLSEAIGRADADSAFDALRRDYPVRHEASGIRVAGRVAPRWEAVLSRLGVAR